MIYTHLFFFWTELHPSVITFPPQAIFGKFNSSGSMSHSKYEYSVVITYSHFCSHFFLLDERYYRIMLSHRRLVFWKYGRRKYNREEYRFICLVNCNYKIDNCCLSTAFFLSFFWSGLRGSKAYSLWDGVVPKPDHRL